MSKKYSVITEETPAGFAMTLLNELHDRGRLSVADRRIFADIILPIAQKEYENLCYKEDRAHSKSWSVMDAYKNEEDVDCDSKGDSHKDGYGKEREMSFWRSRSVMRFSISLLS